MRRMSPYVLFCTVLAGIWIVAGCPKQAPPEGTAVQKPPAVSKPPEAKPAQPEVVMLADKAPEEATAMTNPVKAEAASLEKGKKLYVANCADCHGEKGDGKGSAGAGLKPPPANFTDKAMMTEHTDGALHWAITEGGGAMPSFSKSLSDEDRWDVVNYIRTFAK